MFLKNYYGIKVSFKNELQHGKYELTKLKGGLSAVTSELQNMFNSYKSIIVGEQTKRNKCQVSIKQYKTTAEIWRGKAYGCKGNTLKNKRLLKHIEGFYSYLQKRLYRFNRGIHHMKQVGLNLRYYIIFLSWSH